MDELDDPVRPPSRHLAYLHGSPSHVSDSQLQESYLLSHLHVVPRIHRATCTSPASTTSTRLLTTSFFFPRLRSVMLAVMRLHVSRLERRKPCRLVREKTRLQVRCMRCTDTRSGHQGRNGRPCHLALHAKTTAARQWTTPASHPTAIALSESSFRYRENGTRRRRRDERAVPV